MAGSRTKTPVLLPIFIGVVLLLAGWTAMNFRGGVAPDDIADRDEATATVNTCEEVGPLSLSGVGYWWSCRATVTTQDGDSYDQVFNGSQFDPDDRGEQFRVVNAGQYSNSWTRADIPARNWATVATAIGLIGGAICLIMGFRGLLRR
ncbi:MAG TPA: hypothetical protein H9881_02160 [Candidatus Stackebrandtia excrementipullorum]|nr:hypothetical protein [Candidatus Stackebrandtia excrementipullorum]